MPGRIKNFRTASCRTYGDASVRASLHLVLILLAMEYVLCHHCILIYEVLKVPNVDDKTSPGYAASKIIQSSSFADFRGECGLSINF
jgi:hypothetical protein